MPETLDDSLNEQIQARIAEGDALAEAGRYDEAIARYHDGWALLPEPRWEWGIGMILQVAIGDAALKAGALLEAKERFITAAVMGGVTNGYVQLRLGQTYFELGDMERAAEHLCRAYIAERRRIFEGEDPKYLAFLATVMDPPAGQDEL
jgi:tetratricopeptide (TPR) repeat protein